MLAIRYSTLLTYIKPEYKIPEHFFELRDNETSCIFLVACLDNERVLYIDDAFETVTGYPAKTLHEKGLSFWFPLIHPGDMPAVTTGIKKSHEELATPGFPRPFPPMILEYRFKKSDDTWARIKETKYLLLEGSEAIIDKVLCKLELLNDEKESCSKLLDFAMAYDPDISKKFENNEYPSSKRDLSEVTLLTKREREILSLIGRGLSTKMIADKCNISINTVETHRRHLLEKLKVKNSMELIKKASRISLLD